MHSVKFERKSEKSIDEPNLDRKLAHRCRKKSMNESGEVLSVRPGLNLEFLSGVPARYHLSYKASPRDDADVSWSWGCDLVGRSHHPIRQVFDQLVAKLHFLAESQVVPPSHHRLDKLT